MKKNAASTILITLCSSLFVLAACGAAATVETAGSSDESPPTTNSSTAEETTTSAANSSNGPGDWVTTDDQLTNFQPTSEGSVNPDPTSGSQLIVTFPAGFAPCAGGRAMATETADAVVISIEVGVHQNVAAMTCPAGTDEHQLILPLAADVGDRALSIDGAS